MPDLDRFFESSAIKDTFDNLRNVLISSTVLVAGFYLIEKVSPKALWEIAVLGLGGSLVLTGVLLFIICALDGHYKITKNLKKPIKRWPTVLTYLSISTLIMFTSLHLNGIVFK